MTTSDNGRLDALPAQLCACGCGEAVRQAGAQNKATRLYASNRCRTRAAARKQRSQKCAARGGRLHVVLEGRCVVCKAVVS